jgi:hypothetical protein
MCIPHFFAFLNIAYLQKYDSQYFFFLMHHTSFLASTASDKKGKTYKSGELAFGSPF